MGDIQVTLLIGFFNFKYKLPLSLIKSLNFKHTPGQKFLME